MSTRRGNGILLIDPEMCRSCRFARISEVVVGGVRKATIECRRLDCDNWQHPENDAGQQLILRHLLGRPIELDRS